MSRATLKAEMTEQWNDGTTENLPKSYDGMAEGTKSPEILRDRTMKRQEITWISNRQNDRKSPEILKDRMMESQP